MEIPRHKSFSDDVADLVFSIFELTYPYIGDVSRSIKSPSGTSGTRCGRIWNTQNMHFSENLATDFHASKTIVQSSLAKPFAHDSDRFSTTFV